MVGALRACEESVSGSWAWRVHGDLLAQLASLASCLPPDLTHSQLAALMLQRMHTAVRGRRWGELSYSMYRHTVTDVELFENKYTSIEVFVVLHLRHQNLSNP